MATPKKGSKKSATKKATAKKTGLVFPVGRIGTMLRKGRYAKRVSTGAAIFMAATLEYLTAEALELATKVSGKSKRITPRALCLAIRHDADLGSLLQNVTISRGGVVGGAVTKKATKKEKKAAKKATKKADAPTKKARKVPPAAVPRKVLAKAPAAARTHKWQYKSNSGHFADYDGAASDAVEVAYVDWLKSPHVDVRSVKSGAWDYMVDFNSMQQQNIRHGAHTLRDIRRVAA